MLQQIQFNQTQNRGNSTNQVIPMKNRVNFMGSPVKAAEEIERTVFGLKPGAFANGEASAFLQEMLERTGTHIKAINHRVQDKITMETHYDNLKNEPYFRDVIDKNVTKGPFAAYLLEGKNAIENVRTTLMDLRKEWGVNGMPDNIGHASDSASAAVKEGKNFFAHLYA